MRARSRGPDNGPLTGAPNPNCISSSRQDWVSAVNLMSGGGVRYSVSISRHSGEGRDPRRQWIPAFAGMAQKGRPGAASGEEALFFEALVQVGDELAVAVKQQGRAALVGAEDAFGCLAPARMRHLGVNVGPEPVFARLQGFPIGFRALVGEFEM